MPGNKASRLLSVLGLVVVQWTCVFPVLANQLQSVGFSALPGNRVEISLQLKEPLQEQPLAFSTADPARVVLDLKDTLNKLPHKTVPVALGPVHSVVAVEAGERTRVVVNLLDAAGYELHTQDNQILLQMGGPQGERAEKEAKRQHNRIYQGERISLNFQDIEIRSVLQLLADFTGLNMVASDTVEGHITLRLKHVPWDQAMDIILQAKGLSMRRHDKVIWIAPAEEIAAREKLELEAQQQRQELAPLRSELIQINYAKAVDLAALLKAKHNRLLSERGNVTVDGRTNTLLVQDTAAKLGEIRALTTQLDRPVRQVMIESRIVIANNDFARDLGVRLGVGVVADGIGGGSRFKLAGGLQGNVASTEVASTSLENPAGSGNQALLVNLPQTLAAGSGGAVNFIIGEMASHLLRLELNAMQQEGKGEIISSPRVITSDQNTAIIKQGIEIPYQEATSGGATSVSFKEAVLQLEVTPHITPDGRVIMNLKVNKDNPDYARSVLGVPPIDTRELKTSVLVDNGETLVLGGIFERTQAKSSSRIPFLGDLPYVGFLFKQEQIQDENSELLIFVTPKIL